MHLIDKIFFFLIHTIYIRQVFKNYLTLKYVKNQINNENAAAI
jgi:hypothetical protein